jgi:hypothetical protein
LTGKQTIDKVTHAQQGLAPMWLLWETMYLTLLIAIVAIDQFYQIVDSCGSANDRFNYGYIGIQVIFNSIALLV